MSISDDLSVGFRKILDLAGTQLKLRYYSISVGSIYDDDTTYTQSGADLWLSGVVFPLNQNTGTEDSILLEQGKIQDQDKRVYIAGSIALTGDSQQVKIQIGSPTGQQNYLLSEGASEHEVNGVPVYKKAYIRRLTNGSFIGE